MSEIVFGDLATVTDTESSRLCIVIKEQDSYFSDYRERGGRW